MAARNKNRRRRNRGRFGFLFKLLCVIAVLVALTVGATVFFQVEHVLISGNARYREEQVVEASGIEMGDNLFRLNKNQIGDQIRQRLPYVKELTINRSLPNTVLIGVTEWDAVASVQVNQSPPVQEDIGEDVVPLEVATQPWLISVGGKLLEVAPEGSTTISVTGITVLAPSPGTKMAVPQSEQSKLSALLTLLQALEEQDALGKVEWVDFSPSTHLLLRYEGRFDVKIPLGDEIAYKLKVLAKAAETRESYESGSMDLTQKDYAVVYSQD